MCSCVHVHVHVFVYLCICMCVYVHVLPPGVHCEGPFISQRKKGAHQEAYIQDSVCQQTLQACYGSLDAVRIITLAPELPGAMEVIRWLSEEHNIVVSLGHTMARIGTAEKAIKNGASLITHLFNAMLPVSMK